MLVSVLDMTGRRNERYVEPSVLPSVLMIR